MSRDFCATREGFYYKCMSCDAPYLCPPDSFKRICPKCEKHQKKKAREQSDILNLCSVCGHSYYKAQKHHLDDIKEPNTREYEELFIDDIDDPKHLVHHMRTYGHDEPLWEIILTHIAFFIIAIMGCIYLTLVIFTKSW